MCFNQVARFKKANKPKRNSILKHEKAKAFEYTHKRERKKRPSYYYSPIVKGLNYQRESSRLISKIPGKYD